MSSLPADECRRKQPLLKKSVGASRLFQSNQVQSKFHDQFKENRMCIGVIGGMDRLERHYQEAAAQVGIELRIFNRSEVHLGAKLKHVDALLIFTGKVSHRVKKEALNAVKGSSIPVFLHHSCGVCTLRDCLNCLLTTAGGSRSG
jgi:hypothetical protein